MPKQNETDRSQQWTNSSTATDAQDPPRPGDVPNEAEAESEFGVTDDGRPLAEQTDLVDDDGDDIRQYSGEPVATEHGYVIPTQSPAGDDNVVGGGEWPGKPDRGTSSGE